MAKSTRRWPRRPPRWAALSALAGLVVLGWLAWPRGGTPDVRPLALAMSIHDAAPGLPFDASRPSEGIPGASVRGDAASEREPESAAQAGAFLVRLALAIQEGDSAATATLARQTHERFDPQGGSALGQIQARAGAPSAELQPLLEEATDRLERRLDPGHLRLGAWTEAARLAAGQQDAGYFRSRNSAAMLRRAERLTHDDPQARQAVQAVRLGLPVEDRADWTALEKNLAALLQAIAT